MYGTWEMRGHDSICVLDLFLFFWKMMDTAGHGWDMACATKKKKKLYHTISHTNLLPLPLTLISSAANLLPIPIFSSSPLALSISLLQFPPLPLFLFCSCLFSLFFIYLLLFFFFPISHYHTCRALLPPTIHVNKRCVNMCFFSNFCPLWVKIHYYGCACFM